MKRYAWLLVLPWTVSISSRTPCPDHVFCQDLADTPTPDFYHRQIACHPETQEACQDFVDAMNEANRRRTNPETKVWITSVTYGSSNMSEEAIEKAIKVDTHLDMNRRPQ